MELEIDSDHGRTEADKMDVDPDHYHYCYYCTGSGVQFE